MQNEQEIQEFHKRYKKDYEKQIQPQLQELEKERQTKHKLAICVSWIVNLLAISFVVYVFLTAKHDTNSYLVSLGGSIILLLIAQTPFLFLQNSFCQSIKTRLNQILIPYKNIEQTIKSQISDEEIRRAEIVNDFDDRVNHINYIGDYKSTKISISRTTMANENGFTFNGVVIKIAPTCEYTGKTVIVPPTTVIANLQEIKHPDYEEEYKIYSTSELDAEEIISPHLLTALNDLKKVYNANTLKATIKGTEIYISISYSPQEENQNSKLFSSPISVEPQYNELLNKFDCIFKVVNEINLP